MAGAPRAAARSRAANDAAGDHSCGLAGRAAEQPVGVRRGHVESQVEAIEQRTGQAPAVAGQLAVAAPAPAGSVRLAARARIHRGDEQDVGGQDDRGRGARDADPPLLEWLTQRVEHVGRELAELVQEEHPVRGAAHLTRSERRRAATDDGHHRGAVVRVPERWPHEHPRPRAAGAGGRVDLGDGEGLCGVQIGKQARQAAREHRLARPGRTDHEQVVPSGRGDLERLSGRSLATHVGEVGNRVALRWRWLGRQGRPG